MVTKTQTEIFAILGEWRRVREDGVTQKQFAADRGLSVRTLREWERRFEPKAESPAEMIAKAQVLVDELKRMIDALKLTKLEDTGPNQVRTPIGTGSGHPDHRWFF
jgi:transcriptional regulator with XRE-family HTH domain